MKAFIKAYTSFTSREKMGLVALLVLLVLLITVRATMQFWIKPETDEAQQLKLVKAWEDFKAEQNAPAVNRPEITTDQPRPAVVETHKAEQNPASSKLFSFDPNTIDSTGLRQLGLKAKTASILLHWRAKGKVFYKKEELKKLYTLTEEEYNRLEPYIVISHDH
jgi:competence protein ComEA